MPTAVAQWERITPPADAMTGCGRGADYAFFFRPGTENKLVIDFEGGGGCWDVLTCLLPTWSTTVGNNPPSATGLLADNAENPTRGWSYLFVPYCTGDVHLGAREAAGVNFNGRANARAALEHAYAAVPDPEAVLTTGCSAGALGSVGWIGHVAERYPNARHSQFGDSFLGVTSAQHWQTLENNWDLLTSFFPAPGMEIERLQQFSDDICPYILAKTAENFGPSGAFPTVTMGQFNFNADSVQIAFSALAGAPSARWTEVMREISPTILDGGANGASVCPAVRSYLLV